MKAYLYVYDIAGQLKPYYVYAASQQDAEDSLRKEFGDEYFEKNLTFRERRPF